MPRTLTSTLRAGEGGKECPLEEGSKGETSDSRSSWRSGGGGAKDRSSKYLGAMARDTGEASAAEEQQKTEQHQK